MQINVMVLCLQFADGMTHAGLVKDKQSITVIHRLLKTNMFESKMLQKNKTKREFSYDFAASVLCQHQRPITLTRVHQRRYCVPPRCHLRWATFDSEEHMQLCPSTE